jgi:hypothetical protein
MRNEILKKLELFVQALYPKFQEHPDRLTISAIATTQYINYLVEKGIVLQSEKSELFRSSIGFIEIQFKLQIPSFVADGLIEIMQEVITYDYETIGFLIKKVNDTFK